jgi:hypothetical protein
MAQIMAVTGHKSASSVAVYQRVSSKEKQGMGDIITSSVREEQPSQLSSIMPPHKLHPLHELSGWCRFVKGTVLAPVFAHPVSSRILISTIYREIFAD